MDDDAELNSSEINASIHFLARLPLYDSVKPYTLGYDPGDGISATNIESEERQVKILSMRLHNLSYEICGFHFCSISSAMRYEDYKDDSLIRNIHFPEVEACLMKVLKASFVQVIDYDVSVFVLQLFCFNRRVYAANISRTHRYEAPVENWMVDRNIE